MSYYQLFQTNGYDFNACNTLTIMRMILYNTDVTTSTVELVSHSPVGKLV